MPLLSAALDWENTPFTARAKKLIAEFAGLMIDLTEVMYAGKPSALLEAVIEHTGYVRALEAERSEENEARLENIKELQGAVSEFERLNPEGGVPEFLENVALVSDLDAMKESGGAVTLMTLHMAKGLEFNNVFIAGMEENVFPLTRAIFDEKLLEEERRLAYVGITRAKRRLFLSHARSRMLYNNRNNNELSRFVTEIPPRLIVDGAGRSSVRRVPPPTQRGRATGASGIPGVQKGASGGFNWNGGGQSRVTRVAAVFHVGDAVHHRVFGRGEVINLSGQGVEQRVRIRFANGDERSFNASAAPIVKVEGS